MTPGSRPLLSFLTHIRSPVISRAFYFQPPRSHPRPPSPPLIFSASLLGFSPASLLPQLTSSHTSSPTFLLFFFFFCHVHCPRPPPVSVLLVRKCSIATQLQVSAKQPLFSPPCCLSGQQHRRPARYRVSVRLAAHSCCPMHILMPCCCSTGSVSWLLQERLCVRMQQDEISFEEIIKSKKDLLKFCESKSLRA